MDIPTQQLTIRNKRIIHQREILNCVLVVQRLRFWHRKVHIAKEVKNLTLEQTTKY